MFSRSCYNQVMLISLAQIYHSQLRYTVTIGEGCCCGPAFGPALAYEILEIDRQTAPGSIVLQMKEPVALYNDLISHLVVTPRYKGDTLCMLRERGCIVDIEMVLPGRLDQLRKGDSMQTTAYVGVGECRPVRGQ